jgi:hypothetical protein
VYPKSQMNIPKQQSAKEMLTEDLLFLIKAKKPIEKIEIAPINGGIEYGFIFLIFLL